MAFARQVIQVPGRSRLHSPVPEGMRIGDWLFSSLLGPTNGHSGENAQDDAVLLFRRIQNLLDAAGASPDNLVSLAVYVLDDKDRAAINGEWVKMFPNPDDRPARHILNVDPNGTHWRFAAWVTAILGDQLGRMINSPLVVGRVKGSDELPSDRLKEVEVMFDNLKAWIEGEGGTLDNIASVMVYLMEDDRDTVNKVWAKVFPDTSDLPCRQTLIMQPAGLSNANYGVVATAVL
jgi:2-iminobutanoate/2-iminopropanoate deaminase